MIDEQTAPASTSSSEPPEPARDAPSTPSGPGRGDVPQGLLSRIRDGEQAARDGEVEREAMKARNTGGLGLMWD